MSVDSKCPAHLSSTDDCLNQKCGDDCQHVVKQNDTTGRWFITMGHAGFNSPANNDRGYATRRGALSKHRWYASRAGYANAAVR